MTSSLNSAEGLSDQEHSAKLQAQEQLIAKLQAQLQESAAEKAQLEHEGEKLKNLAQELTELDLNSLTPLMALNVLSELKAKLSAS